MRFLSRNEVPDAEVIGRFGRGRVQAFVLLLLAAGIPVPFAWGILNSPLPWWSMIAVVPLALVIGSIWCLVVGSVWHGFIACFRATNWTAKVACDGLYLQIRSCFNYHFPLDGPTVAFVPFEEIVSANKTIVHTRGDDGKIKIERYVDLHVKTGTEKLRRLVVIEANRKAPETRFSSTRFNHSPVLVPEPGVVRVEWVGKRLLDLVAMHVDIKPVRRSAFGDGERDVEDEIIGLIESGRMMDAIMLVRRHYRMKLTEAREFVEQLSGEVLRAQEDE